MQQGVQKLVEKLSAMERNNIGKFRTFCHQKPTQKLEDGYKTLQKIPRHQHAANSKDDQTLKAILYDNESLKCKIEELQTQNILLLEEREKTLKELTKCLYQSRSKSSIIENKQQNNQLLQYVRDDTTPQTKLQDTKEQCQMLSYIHSMQEQIKMLIMVKSLYEDKYRAEKEKNLVFSSKISLLMQENKKYEKRLEKYIQYNRKCEVEIAKLEVQLQEALRDIQKLLTDEKDKEQANFKDIQEEMEKMKDKNEKYRYKMQQYKTQRNELAHEMKKLYQEIGTTSSNSSRKNNLS